MVQLTSLFYRLNYWPSTILGNTLLTKTRVCTDKGTLKEVIWLLYSISDSGMPATDSL